MAHTDLCCGLYRGTIYLKDNSDADAALLPVGNAELEITQELAEITQPNFQSLGGNACSVNYTSAVNVNLTLHCSSPENLAKAFLGTITQKAGAQIDEEEITVKGQGELIPFANVPNRSYPIVVKSEDDVTTYVSGTDYQVTNAGIIILNGAIEANDVIHIAYTYSENIVLDAQTVSQKEYYMVLDGYNAGDGRDTPVVIKAWKVKLAPAESFSVISGEEFASLALTGEILRDESKVAPISKFFQVEWGNNEAGGY